MQKVLDVGRRWAKMGSGKGNVNKKGTEIRTNEKETKGRRRDKKREKESGK